MPDPSTLRDMDKGAARLADAIVRRERVAVFGDYDVDGACSSALMQRFLGAHGLEARIYIPDRMFEGYGPNPAAIETLARDGAKLIVTVDCGTTSIRPAGGGGPARRRRGRRRSPSGRRAAAGRCGGHQSQPAGRPLRARAPVCGGRHLHGAGSDLAASAPQGGTTPQRAPAPDLLALLDLVALATVCDVVPLKGLNRAFVTRGLQVMRARDAMSGCGRSPMPPAWRWRRRPITWVRAGASHQRRRPHRRRGAWRASAGDRGRDGRGAHRCRARQAEPRAQGRRSADAGRGGGLADRLVEADPDVPLLLLGSESWHKGVVGSGGQPAGRAVPATGLRHRLGQTHVEEGTGSLAARSDGRRYRRCGTRRRSPRSAILEKGGGHAMAAGLTVVRATLGGARGLHARASGGEHGSSRARWPRWISTGR